MARDGLLIGQVAAKSGISRKALRLYEKAGILPPARRTGSGYRVYGPETLALLGFVTQARRLGFQLDEIARIVTLKRSGRTPCKHVLDLVHLKLENIEQALTDLAEVRGQLRGLLRSWRSRVTLCPAGCGQCPDVEIAGDEVRIGETGNLAVLKKDEWNLLVDLIQSGRLAKI